MLFDITRTRKNFLTMIAGMAATAAGSALLHPYRKLSGLPLNAAGSALIVVKGKDFSKSTIDRMVSDGFREMGGIGRFIKKGMKVVIKPNIGWNSTPGMAHNTNPDLVEAVSRMCIAAGASVKIFDRSVNTAQLTYPRSGIEAAAKRAGASISFVDDRKFREVTVPGALLHKTLPVYEEILDADFVINMPIAKHHSISTLTLAMKNLMGVLGGNRGIYHGDIHRSIVDFNKAVKVDLVIMDATRILTAHGPNGGTAKDIIELKTIIMGINPVTVDAYTATLFNINPESLGFLALASRERMGEIQVSNMKVTRRSV